MKNIEQVIREAIQQVDLRKPSSVTEAANRILSEDMDVSQGETVAIIDDPTYAQPGIKAKVIGPSAKGSGFVDVELPNGVKLPVQSSLLLTLK